MKGLLVALGGMVVVSLALLLLSGPPAAKKPSLVKTLTFRGARFDVVELPLASWDVRVSWKPGGAKLSEVTGAVRTNAGIFEPGFTPTGLLISDGEVQHPLELKEGAGNFYLRPNGVFALTEAGAMVVESGAFDGGGVLQATQSGPLLVQAGALHPQFQEASEHRVLRSGVGVRDGGRTVVLAISRDDVNLWTFGALFRDALQCPDALYLDGVISALWAADSGRGVELRKGPFAGILTASPTGPR